MSQNRYVVVPTVTVLAVMKARLVGAVKGHALLKKKADALTVRHACLVTYSILPPPLHAGLSLPLYASRTTHPKLEEQA